MFFKDKKPINTSHINIKLKTIFGIKPEIYILLMFYVVAITCFIALTFLPGLLNYGSMVKVVSNVKGASVYVGDKRLGHTPLKSFVKAGKNQTFTIKKEGFEDVVVKTNIGGRYFLSLILPKGKTIKAKMVFKDLDFILQDSFAEASAWVLRAESKAFPRYDIIYQVAQMAETLWKDLDDFDKQQFKKWALQIPALISDDTSLGEIMDSWFIMKKLMPDLSSSIIDTFLKDKKATVYLALSTMSNKYSADDDKVMSGFETKAPISLNGINFNYAAPATTLMGYVDEFDGRADYEYYPHQVKVDGFYYMHSLVSEAMLADFILKTNYSETTSLYNRNDLGNASAKNVDFNLASAYASYLDKMLNNDDLEVRLPSEAEWEVLAKQKLIDINSYEWTSDPYLVFRNVWYQGVAYLPIQLKSSVYVVKGIDKNLPFTMDINMRGSQEVKIKSPHLGFRVVVAKKR